MMISYTATIRSIAAAVRPETRVSSAIITPDSEPAWIRPITKGLSGMMADVAELQYPVGVPSAQPWTILKFESKRGSTILVATQEMDDICCCKVTPSGDVRSPWSKVPSHSIRKKTVDGGNIWLEHEESPKMVPGAGAVRENVFMMLRVGAIEHLIMLVLPSDFRILSLFEQAKRIAKVRKPSIMWGGIAGVVDGDRAEICRVIQDSFRARLIELSVP